MSNAIRCKKTGQALAMKTGGGECVCPSTDKCKEAALAGKPGTASPSTNKGD